MKKLLIVLCCILLSVAAWAQKPSPAQVRVHANMQVPASGYTYNITVYYVNGSSGPKTKIYELLNVKPTSLLVIDTNFYMNSNLAHVYSDVSRTGCGNSEHDYAIPGNIGTGMSFYQGCAPLSSEVHFDFYVAGIAMIYNVDRSNPADNIYTVDQKLHLGNSYCGWQGCENTWQYSLDGQTYATIPYTGSFSNLSNGATVKEIFGTDYQNFIGRPVYFRTTFSENYYPDNSHSSEDSSHIPIGASEGSNPLVYYFYPTTPTPVTITAATPLCSYSVSNAVTIKFDRAMYTNEILKPISIYKFNSPTDSIIIDQTEYNITALDAGNSVTISGLHDMPPGNYNLTVEGTYAGQVELNPTYYHFTITAPPPVTFTQQAVDATCHGGSNGYITVSAAGGNNTYQYSSDNGATWQPGSTLSGLVKGTYNVLVKDGNGCVAAASQSAIVSEPATGLTSTISIAIDPKGYHTYDGSAGVSVNGGTLPYTYTWSNGGNTATINGLGGGLFSVLAQDVNGCSTTQSVTLVEPDPLVVSFSNTPVSCNGDGDGTLTANVTGGVTPYSYAWAGGQATRKISGLTPGTYNVIITDANNITTSGSYIVTEPAVLVLQLTATNVTCNGAANGIITSNPTGGTAPYQYAWSNSTSAPDANNLAPGNYELDLTDAHGCVVGTSAAITQPDALQATGIITTPTRYGAADGSVDVTVQGGTTPYQYVWSNGTTTEDLSSAGDGTYDVTITDANGCTLARSFAVHQPDPLVLSLQKQADVLCNDSAQGQVYGYVTGGVRPYQYAWSNATTDSVAKRLIAGTYQLTITDKSGVTATANITLTQPTALQVQYVLQQVGCNGEDNGGAAATASGGVSPYDYAWSNGATTSAISGLQAGDYDLTITDGNGCTLQSTASVIAPGALGITGTEKQPTCFGFTDAAITLHPTGGRLPYTYEWSNGSTDKDLQNLVAGEYTIQMKDSSGCLIDHTFTLADPPALQVSLGPDRTLCQGQVLTVDGSVPNGADYVWGSDRGYTAYTALVGLNEAGTYNVTSTNANGCVARDTLVVKTTDQVISADFLVSTQAFAGDTLIIANISYPSLDSVLWSFPSEAQIATEDAGMAEISIGKTGTYEITMTGYLGECIATMTKDVVVISSTSIPMIPTDYTSLFGSVVLRPNPNNGQFALDITVMEDINVNYRVIDFVHNQTMFQRKSQLLKGVKNTETLNVPGLSTGIYLLVIEGPGEIKTLKLMII